MTVLSENLFSELVCTFYACVKQAPKHVARIVCHKNRAGFVERRNHFFRFAYDVL
jgi:hypothetical protein